MTAAGPLESRRDPLVSRLDRFGRIDSTQRVVREWLAGGVSEVCVAVADEQSSGRGRLDRRWLAPPGAGLLVSAGFRPRWLAAERSWQLAAVASLAMIEAVAAVVPRIDARLGLEWPNDLVADVAGRVAKIGGVLGETELLERRVATAIVGIGLNVDWPASRFPPELAGRMTSLHELAGGATLAREAVLAAWFERLLSRYRELRSGRFPGEAWAALQVTTGAALEVDLGERTIEGLGVGADPHSGELLVREPAGGEVIRVRHGEVLRCRVGPVGAGV